MSFASLSPCTSPGTGCTPAGDRQTKLSWKSKIFKPIAPSIEEYTRYTSLIEPWRYLPGHFRKQWTPSTSESVQRPPWQSGSRLELCLDGLQMSLPFASLSKPSRWRFSWESLNKFNYLLLNFSMFICFIQAEVFLVLLQFRGHLR
jgi:hypothetical protein